MPVRVLSSGLAGVDAHPIEVEVDLAPGAYGYETVGLPDTAVREGRQRVKSAIRNAGLKFPQQRVVVNLSPADLRKEGALFDLAIALGILAASGQTRREALEGCLVVGELGLSGAIRSVRGVLAMTLAARDWGLRRVVVPAANASEAATVRGIEVFAAESLAQLLVAIASGTSPELPPASVPSVSPDTNSDLRFVRGQKPARRALEIAAAGGHHLLMVGPPGTGKTLLARCLPGLLPPMSLEERLEVSRIHSVAGMLAGGSLVVRRPFRAPHHTASAPAIIGGGSGVPRPGEVSLAHLGVLMLDELPEFHRSVREVLREPLESGEVQLARSRSHVRFPARFQLVATMNPCPCGYAGCSSRSCRCTPGAIARYESRLSGPVRDRFDLYVGCPQLPRGVLLREGTSESTEAVNRRVQAARNVQERRLASSTFRTNAEVRGQELERLCQLEPQTLELASRAADRIGLSARGVHRALRVARTIADLAGEPQIQQGHLAEALQFRDWDSTQTSKPMCLQGAKR